MIVFLKKYKFELSLSIIIVIGAFLRFYNLASMSLYNDELSAMSRLQFDNFSDLINKGVKTDGHPAGIQVFLYYWTSFFGNSVFAFRFPFVIAGILSIYYVFVIGKMWFGKSAALLSAVVIAFSSYTILYSQLARPYSIGLLFVLLNALFWTKFFIQKEISIRIVIGYIITATLCAYTHYFSFLTVLIIGITGLFYLNRSNFLKVAIIVASVIILYLPHFNISSAHLSMGGVGGWLPIPSSEWIWEYLFYIANNSLFVISYILIIFIATITIATLRKKLNVISLISLLWFVLVFIIGYFYSVYVNPVIQYSVLLFVFPFLVLFLFSFISNLKFPFSFPLLATGSILLIYSTVFENKYYQSQHFGEIKAIAERITDWNNLYGKDNIAHTINVNRPFYIQYYLPKDKDSTHFYMYSYEDRQGLLRYKEILDTCSKKYFLFAWTNRYSYPEINEIIKQKYPYLVATEEHFNAAIYLYSKEKDGINRETSPKLTFLQGFETSDLWGHPDRYLDTIYKTEGRYGYRFDETLEFGPTFNLKYADSKLFGFKKAVVSLDYISIDKNNTDIHLVSSIKSDNESVNWESMPFQYQTLATDSIHQIVFVYDLPENVKLKQDDIFQIYVWNQAKRKFVIDNIQIAFFEN
jgi:hypothetical protein